MRCAVLLVLGLLLFGPTPWLEASEKEEARERAETAKPFELEREMAQLHERLLDLAAKERELREADASQEALVEFREQRIQIERELRERHAQRTRREHQRPELREHAERLEAAARRIHHIRVAAENLEAAELHDLADELRKKAEAMERDVQQARTRLAVEMQRTAAHREGEELRSLVNKLREEVEKLREEVRELRRDEKQ